MAKKQTGASLPTDVAVEEAIIGTILTNADALKRVSGLLTLDDFWSSEIGTIFDVCVFLDDRHQEVNQQTVTRELANRDALDDIGGADYLDKLMVVADTVAFSSNASTVRNLSILRRIIQVGNKMVKEAVVPSADSNIILQDVDSEFNALRSMAKGMGPRIVKLEILTSNPRKYRIRFSNGEDVDMSIEDILNPKAAKHAIINTLDFVPALPKDWEGFMKNLMVGAKKSLAPPNADVNIEILDVIKDLFEARGEGKEASDLRSGSYALEDINGKQYYLFQKSAIVTYVKQQLDKKMSTADLWQLVYSWGGIDKKDGKAISKRIGSSTRTALWALPAKVIEEGIIKKEDKIEMKDGKIDVSFL